METLSKKTLAICAFLLLFTPVLFAQTPSLQEKLSRLLETKKGNIGVSVRVIESGEQTAINGNKHYPMQSVYKFHLALAVLDAVDKKTISLDQKVTATKKDLRANTWSPLRDKFPEGTDISVASLLDYSVSKSDNNACDILFRLSGGTAITDAYIRQLGIKDISIVATEEEMTKAWNIQYQNFSSPDATTQLLSGFFEGKYLSAESTTFLMKLMTESSNSSNRMKALLPENTPVAHKTGTSGTNDNGSRAALNDVGIITLPNGKHLAVSVFVSDATEKYEEGERTIAEISKLIWDHYVQ